MKALWIESAGVVRYGDLPDPTPPAGWVRLKILAASICGSDLNAYRSGRKHTGEKKVSGHEFVGVIDMIADKNSPWKLGQRVCVYPCVYCGTCEECREGHINMCLNKQYIGGRTHNGGFAEYTIVPESMLIAVPETISDIDAAMVEPFAVGLHALNQAGGASLKGKRIAIYGSGAIGLFTLESAKYYGVKQIIVVNRSPEKLAIAKAHGATDVVCAKDKPEIVQEKVRQLSGGRGVDAVVDTVGIEVSIDSAMRFCKPHGTVSVVGMGSSNNMVDFRYLLANELTLVGSYTYTTEMEDCVKILAGGHVSISYIANPGAPLSKGSEVFEKMANKSSEYLKAVFLPGTI